MTWNFILKMQADAAKEKQGLYADLEKKMKAEMEKLI